MIKQTASPESRDTAAYNLMMKESQCFASYRRFDKRMTTAERTTLHYRGVCDSYPMQLIFDNRRPACTFCDKSQTSSMSILTVASRLSHQPKSPALEEVCTHSSTKNLTRSLYVLVHWPQVSTLNAPQ